MLNITKILNIITQVGAATPAFNALFDEVKQLFSSADQQTLQDAYARIKAENDAGHAALQDELKKAEGV